MKQKIKRGVAIVAIYNGKIVLLKQMRPPHKVPFLNIVMGSIKNNETPEQAAKRECIEEIGLVPKKLVKIGRIIQLPGSANIETVIFYSEFQEKPSVPKNISEPIIGLGFYSEEEIKKLISKEKIIESTTLLALLLIKK